LLFLSSVQVAALAFLHYLVMLGSTVMLATAIVPAMGGNAVSIQCFGWQLFVSIWRVSVFPPHICACCWQGDKARVIQSFLFMSGINTLLQTLIGTRLPTVMNASFAFVVPVLSIAKEIESNNFLNDHEV
jgi:xanthine/uracil permease